eukprot:CAMPEP_0184224936 /NCGR_PEP_ID=MMETSP0976-20121227/19993_1 /TAXON_ID=483370 /ORGANISM="non described non described, Strain CCMP2097" /LENGTH=192 /DNA_ID=CAMNT_0026529869 /DNA_START=70 /DNA_END=645 /DNA_ORIENTATION=-
MVAVEADTGKTHATRSTTVYFAENVDKFDTDSYRTDLFEDSSGIKTSLAYAVVREASGGDVLEWIQSSRRGGGRELIAQLIEASSGSLAARPTTRGGASDGQSLLLEAGFRPPAGDASGRQPWALDRQLAEVFLFDQAARAAAHKSIKGPAPGSGEKRRASDPRRFDARVEHYMTQSVHYASQPRPPGETNT